MNLDQIRKYRKSMRSSIIRLELKSRKTELFPSISATKPSNISLAGISAKRIGDECEVSL